MDADRKPETLQEKVVALRQIVKRFRSVGVAFSGGVDSTVLLHNCCAALPAGSITALHANSCLQSARAEENVKEIVQAHFTGRCAFRVLDIAPLALDEIRWNGELRCYHCKKATFNLLLKYLKEQGCATLFDGTNCDDLKEHRPGLKAAREIGVISPFVQAGMSKTDIREYARLHGLVNAELPSNSCLATRIETGSEITEELLAKVEEAEGVLYLLGLHGTRVRIYGSHACIELLEEDVSSCANWALRSTIVQRFESLGLRSVSINLRGRRR